MSANNKSLFLLKISDGSEGYKTIAGLNFNNFSLNSQIVNRTNIESGQWQELASVGIKSLSISTNGIFKNSEFEKLTRSIAFLGEKKFFQLQLNNGDLIESDFIISSYTRQGSNSGEELYSFTLESTGAVSYKNAV